MKYSSDSSSPQVSCRDRGSARDPRHGRRSWIGTILAAGIAFILIALILAGISILGQRRLAQFRDEAVIPIRPRHSVRPTPGLGAPSPLVERPGQTAIVAPIGPPAVPAPAPALPPVGIPQVIAPIAPSAPPPVPAPLLATAVAPATRTYGLLASSRIREAVLARPDAHANPDAFQRPQITGDLVEIYRQSQPVPQTIRELVERRRPMPALAERRAQAIMARASAATTKPSE